VLGNVLYIIYIIYKTRRKCGDGEGLGVVMKYDVLERYKRFLEQQGNGVRRLRPSTVDTYYKKMAKLLEGQYLITGGSDVDISKVIEQLSMIEYKNYFSQSKNALKYFLDCYQMTLEPDQQEAIKELENNTKKKYRKLKTVEYKKVKATIDRLKNKKLKLCFSILIATGLRVSELSGIKVSDCTICDDCSNEKIQLTFLGKGGKVEKVFIYKADSPNIYGELEYIIKCSSNKKNEKMFYSANYLQRKAKEYGFSCHDLRRIYAKLEYKKTKSKEAVQKGLRHTKRKTTNLYLNSPIKLK